MKYLIGDIGNTHTKISLLDDKFKILKSFHIKTKKLYKKKNIKFFFKSSLLKDVNRKILFSSVVPEVYKKIKFFLIKFKVYEIHDFNIKKILKFNVDKVKKVGSDRIANAIGSNFKYKKSSIVIDFGTATTFDIIKFPGVYCGGVITPGINLSILNLNKSTALLPKLKIQTTKKIYGKNTHEALNSGFIWGYQGLINNIIKKITLFNKSKYKVILTGGYAKLFKNYIYRKSIVDENITITGVMETYKKFLK
tara:strand:- start:1919 stop:2671 length:753 start_codon:yes stop_codon:yes gene_type:complete